MEIADQIIVEEASQIGSIFKLAGDIAANPNSSFSEGLAELVA